MNVFAMTRVLILGEAGQIPRFLTPMLLAQTNETIILLKGLKKI